MKKEFDDQILEVSKKLNVRPSTIVKYLSGSMNKYAIAKIDKLLKENNLNLDNISVDTIKSIKKDKTFASLSEKNYSCAVWDFGPNSYRMQIELSLDLGKHNVTEMINKILKEFSISYLDVSGYITSSKVNGLIFNIDKNAYLDKIAILDKVKNVVSQVSQVKSNDLTGEQIFN